MKKLLLTISIFILVTASVQAREANFKADSGDILADLDGPERVVVSEEGGLSLFSAEGILVPGFPNFIEGQVFASSPIMTESDEIFALSRDVDDNFQINFIDGQGDILDTKSIAGTFYFDPVKSGNKVFLSSDQGIITEVSYENNLIQTTTVLSPGVASALAVNDTKLFLTPTNEAKLRIYNVSDFQLIDTINLNEAIIYPVIYEVDTFYGVTASGKLTAIKNKTVVPGFPISFVSAAVDSPEIIEGNLLVTLADGSREIINIQGQLVEGEDDLDFVSQQPAKVDGSGQAFHNEGIISMLSDLQKATATSIFSQIKFDASWWNPNDASLLARYRFDEAGWASKKVPDSSGNQNHGTNSGAESLDGAANLDGVSDYIATPIPYNTTGDITVSAWFKTNNSGKSFMSLLGGNNGGRFEVYVDKGRPGCRIWNGGEKSIFADEEYLDVWHKVSCVQSFGDDPGTKLYVDGQLKKSTTATSIPAGGYWHIGKPGSSIANYFVGQVDYVQIHESALSGEEVLANYNAEVDDFPILQSPGNKLFNWKFDEAAWSDKALEVQDSSPAANNGTPQNGVDTVAIEGVNGMVGEFDGIDDYVGSAVPFNDDNDLTVSAWVKTHNLGTSRMTVVGGNLGGRFEMYVNNGFPGCRVWDTGEKSIFSDQQATGEWHKITCVQIYGANPQTKLYVDGKLKKTVNIASEPRGGFWSVGVPGSSTSNYFKGKIDEVKIYRTALNDSEILAEFNSELSNFANDITPIEYESIWEFEEASWNGTPGEVKDSTPNELHGIALGGLTTIDKAGVSGRVADFDGVDDQILTPIVYDGMNDITVVAYYNSSDLSTPRMSMVGGNNGGRFEMYLHEGRPSCRIWDNRDRTIYGPVQTANQWHQVVCVQTYGDNPESKLYIDGKLIESIPNASISAGGTWKIGVSGSSISNHYKGMMDNVGIYQRALSDKEIATMYGE